jgi:hypothetical protein
MVPQNPTPAWAEQCVDRIIKGYDADQIDAFMSLLAAIAPTEDEEKYKHEIAWTAISHAYKQTDDCLESCRRRVLGVAV